MTDRARRTHVSLHALVLDAVPEVELLAAVRLGDERPLGSKRRGPLRAKELWREQI